MPGPRRGYGALVSRGSRRAGATLVSLAALAFGGCGGGDAPEALAAAEPYVERFDRFDGWARRTLAAEPEIRGRSQLEETLFAPLYLEEDVAGAWVVRSRTGEGSWSLRGGEPPAADAGWVRVRHPVHGELGILVAPHPPRPNVAATPCVFLAREAPSASSRVDVVVAFVIGAAGAT